MHVLDEETEILFEGLLKNRVVLIFTYTYYNKNHTFTNKN